MHNHIKYSATTVSLNIQHCGNTREDSRYPSDDELTDSYKKNMCFTLGDSCKSIRFNLGDSGKRIRFNLDDSCKSICCDSCKSICVNLGENFFFSSYFVSSSP